MQTHRQNQAEDEPSDADSLPHRLINPNQYNSSLLSESVQVHTLLVAQSAREVDVSTMMTVMIQSRHSLE